jgi:hypothetical protein
MTEEKVPYEQPKILASYQKGELEAIISPHGSPEPNGGGGCGCGCGCGGG